MYFHTGQAKSRMNTQGSQEVCKKEAESTPTLDKVNHVQLHFFFVSNQAVRQVRILRDMLCVFEEAWLVYRRLILMIFFFFLSSLLFTSFLLSFLSCLFSLPSRFSSFPFIYVPFLTVFSFSIHVIHFSCPIIFSSSSFLLLFSSSSHILPLFLTPDMLSFSSLRFSPILIPSSRSH